MPRLNLKATHAPVKKYYDTLHQLTAQMHISHEGAVKDAFADLLKFCGKQFKWTLVGEYSIERKGKNPIRVDGALIDQSNLRRGLWEAKDSADDLEKEIKSKVEKGYPTNNIIFQEPKRAVLLQKGKGPQKFDLDQPEELVDLLTRFFEFEEPEIGEWEQAVEEFSERIPELAGQLKEIIDEQRLKNSAFVEAFRGFVEVCRQAINPNINEEAVERMLIQHLLTERIFRRIFNNPDFAKRNVIAAEIEKVIAALTSKSFSRGQFLAQLDHFYKAIERAAEHSEDWTEKQRFLNTVYERFFQGYSAKEADVLGIVYTPQEIVDFMVRSVEEILQKEFGRSLSDENVHILDPFVGTGSFIVRVMKEIRKTALEQKYKQELWCNEIMLLPYYIASMNIEHEYFERTGRYEAFEGICLVDTFELAEGTQGGLGFMNAANTARVEKQKKAAIKVVIGNPPYNAGQMNENDNNKNRKYPVIDKRVSDTYGKASSATLLRKLQDPYIKALRWASDRIGDDGVIGFVSNASFLDDRSLDGVRGCLAKEFDSICVIDLGGNVRKNPKLSGTTHNVFGIQIGVSITFLVRKRQTREVPVSILYGRAETGWRREQKLQWLDTARTFGEIAKTRLSPDAKNNWLTSGMYGDYETLTALAASDEQSGIFGQYSLGVSTNRDDVVYDFREAHLLPRVERFIGRYEDERVRLARARSKNLDEFDFDTTLKWSRDLKAKAARGKAVGFDKSKVLTTLYRPYTTKLLYRDAVIVDRPGADWLVREADGPRQEDVSIAITDVGGRSPFSCLALNRRGDLHLLAASDGFQYFPFSVWEKHAKENVTDWALTHFRTHYADKKITKWDIFHYVYAVLHHPAYRERYAANLKRELPRIPYAPKESFWPLVKSGKGLMEIHVGYEEQPEYKRLKETEKGKLDWRVEKMRLSKDKTTLVYNDFLTLSGIPPAVYEYRLGNRSALEWVIDQYQVSTDKRSGIVNDPNREDDPKYIYKLIKKVITVSLETVEMVKGLPDLGLPREAPEAVETSKT